MGAPYVNPQTKNDLDLKVTSPTGTVYWGNCGLWASNWSSDDCIGPNRPSLYDQEYIVRDTVENVFIQTPEPGTWVIEVIVGQIVEDGHLVYMNNDPSVCLTGAWRTDPETCGDPVLSCIECSPLDADFALVASAVQPDCNENGVDDVEDIAQGTSVDCDDNGVPDECEGLVSSPPRAEMMIDENKNLAVGTKNRFLSFVAGDPGQSQAIRVTFVDLPPPYDQFNGNYMWVGEPLLVTEKPNLTDPGQERFPDFWAAKLQCDPYFSDWTTLTGDCYFGNCRHSENAGAACTDDSDCVPAVLHAYGEFIVPGATSSVPDPIYAIQVVNQACALDVQGGFSEPLNLNTSLWGDVCGLYVNVNGVWSAPDGVCSISRDVTAVLSKVSLGPLEKARADVIGPAEPGNMQPDMLVTLTRDVLRVLSACGGRPFPALPPPWPCP